MELKQGRTAKIKKVLYFIFALFLLTVLLLEVNFLSTVPAVRFDLTKSGQHTLSDTTRVVLKELSQTVKLTAFYSGLPPKYLEDMLREYDRLSRGLVSHEIIDPLKQLGYAARFGSVIKGGQNKIIVQSGFERREVDFTGKPLDEEVLTNTIMRVTRKGRNVYFLTGHGERNINDKSEEGFSIFNGLLNSNWIRTGELMLGVHKGIPGDCDVLVIAGPKSHFSREEAKAVNDYLRRGGDALFLIENVIVTTPDAPLTEAEKSLYPSLNNILTQWGVKVGDDIVVDLGSHAGEDVGSPATRNYLPHEALVKDLDYTFYVRPRSISALEDIRPGLKVAPVVLTMSPDKSWGETNRTLQVKYDEGTDRPGPVPISFVMWEGKNGGKDSDTRILVFTDADFLSNAYVTHYSNAQLGLNAVRWLSDLDYTLIINRDNAKIEKLDLTSSQKKTVLIILLLLPVFVLFYGIRVWVKTW